MRVQATVDSRSLRRLDAALRALPGQLRRDRVAIAALRRASKPMAEQAARLAPRDTGNLQQNIVIRTVKRSRRDTVAVDVRPSGKAWYGRIREFGQDDGPAQPFMRPAWDSARGGLVPRIAREMWIGIRRAAKRGRGR